MILSNISTPLVGAVDTAVVGHLPEVHHIGAVALGALVFSFLYWGFGFLKMGATGFVAQAYGARNQSQIDEHLLRFVFLGLGFGLLVILLGRPLVYLALELVNSSENVEYLAREYSLIRIWSAPATLSVYVFTGVFIGLHKTRYALYLQLVLNLTNIFLDLLFVPVLGLGVPGVAWATVIAEFSAALFGAYLLRHHLRTAWSQISRSRLLDVPSLKILANTNANIFVRTICLVFSFAFFTAQSAHLGELYLAINTVLLHFLSFSAYGIDGISHATEALGGSTYGEKNRQRFLTAVRLTSFWSLATAVMLSLGFLLFGEHIIRLFSNIPEVVDGASQYLLWMVISPILSFASFQLDGLFIGMGRAREMRNAMLVSTACYILLVLLLREPLGNHGLFLALSAFMVIRALTLYYYYPGVVRTIPDNQTA